jgi:hypothetical protein
MKKTILAFVLVAAATVIGLLLFRNLSATSAGAAGEVSPRAAEMLQGKIDAIKTAHENESSGRAPEPVDVSETELESYVLYSLRDDIPAQLDSIDVVLSTGTVSSDSQLTFNNASGNPILDTLVGGTHNLFLKGRLSGAAGRGKFDLEEVRVDGIPMPMILIETIFKKYVQPRYPDADLKEPFDLPWGIEEIRIGQEKATIVY